MGKKGKVNVIGFGIELIGAALVSFGVFAVPLQFFANALIAELLVALGMLIMLVGRFLR